MFTGSAVYVSDRVDIVTYWQTKSSSTLEQESVQGRWKTYSLFAEAVTNPVPRSDWKEHTLKRGWGWVKAWIKSQLTWEEISQALPFICCCFLYKLLPAGWGKKILQDEWQRCDVRVYCTVLTECVLHTEVSSASSAVWTLQALFFILRKWNVSKKKEVVGFVQIRVSQNANIHYMHMAFILTLSYISVLGQHERPKCIP